MLVAHTVIKITKRSQTDDTEKRTKSAKSVVAQLLHLPFF